MASVITNRGKTRILEGYFRADNLPANFEARLVTSTITGEAVDVNTMADLTELPTGNGYSQASPLTIERSAVGWDTITEDDTGNLAKILAKDLSYTASGGAIPASGNPARYIAVCTPGAAAANRDVIALLDLGADTTIPDGQTRIFQDCEVRATE